MTSLNYPGPSSDLGAESNDSPPWNGPTKAIVAVILFVMFVVALYWFRAIFTPLIIAAIIAFVIYPLAQWLGQVSRLKHEIATVIVYLVLLALFIPAGILIVPVLAVQVQQLQEELLVFIQSLGNLSTQTIVIVPGLELGGQELINELTATLTEAIRFVAGESVHILVGASKTVLLVILTIFIAFYLTADAHKFVRWFESLGPASYRADVDKLLRQVNAIWSDFFRGQVILAFVVALIITTVSFAIGLPQPLLMGILAGLLEFLVSVGHTIWLIVALVIALVDGSTWLPVSNWVFALIVVATNLLFTKFDLNFLIPKIVGERVNLHPMVVLIGIIIGASVAGVLGIALAAPTIATLRVIGSYIHAKMFDLEPFVEHPLEEAAATGDASSISQRPAQEPAEGQV